MAQRRGRGLGQVAMSHRGSVTTLGVISIALITTDTKQPQLCVKSQGCQVEL